MEGIFQNMFGGLGGGQDAGNQIKMDTGETIYISSLALLKMLKHSKAGVPLEVMGLMLGEFVDEYTIKCVDVFSMPQSASGEAVEAVDPEFQAEMLEMLKQTGRQENMIGWYHSHPSFGPWLSGTDIQTQKSFENLNARCVALVIDPIQSVRGKVVWDAFRLMNIQNQFTGGEPRQTTSNLGHMNPPSLQALAHGLNKYYYSINIKTSTNDLENKMLQNIYKPKWTQGLHIQNYQQNATENCSVLQQLTLLASQYEQWIEEEKSKNEDQLKLRNVGKIDPKRLINEKVQDLMSENLIQTLGTMNNLNAF